MKPGSERPQGPVNPALRLSGIGMELVGAIAGMTLIGWLVDRWLGTSPIWLLVGVGLGFVGGGYNFIREALASTRQAKEAYDRTHPRKPNSRPRNGGSGDQTGQTG